MGWQTKRGPGVHERWLDSVAFTLPKMANRREITAQIHSVEDSLSRSLSLTHTHIKMVEIMTNLAVCIIVQVQI